MQPKMGGKFHLKLNIGERPIANKYREGKMKRTLKRELKSTWNCWKGTVWSQSCFFCGIRISCFGLVMHSQLLCRSTSVWDVGKKFEEWWSFGCYSLLCKYHFLDWGSQQKLLADCASEVKPLCKTACWLEFCLVFTVSFASNLLRIVDIMALNRPVLKHGPRSLTYMRVFGWQTHMRNESEIRCETSHEVAPSADSWCFYDRFE